MLKIKLKFKATLLLSLLLCISPINAKVIIWDLGDTLLKADHLAMAGEIGIGDLFLHALIDWKNPMGVKDQVFDILHSIDKDNTRKFIPTYQDKNLPEPICKWLEGKKSGSAIYKDVSNFIEQDLGTDIFASDRHKKIIKNSVKSMFTPKKLAHNMKPIRSAVKLFEKCTKNNHKVIIFSNFDAKTFDSLKRLKRNRRIFRNIKSENITISGRTGLLKPDPQAYQYLIDKYKLDPKDCIMIDDQVANIKVAEEFGITGIVFEGARKLEKELKAKKII